MAERLALGAYDQLRFEEISRPSRRSNRSQCYRTKIWISKNRDQRLALESRPIPPASSGRPIAETGTSPLTRGILARSPRDRTRPKPATVAGWGARTRTCKRPFEMSEGFRLILEHIGTRDFSRVCCKNCEKQPPAALGAPQSGTTGLGCKISDIGQRSGISRYTAAHGEGDSACLLLSPKTDSTMADLYFGFGPWSRVLHSQGQKPTSVEQACRSTALTDDIVSVLNGV